MSPVCVWKWRRNSRLCYDLKKQFFSTPYRWQNWHPETESDHNFRSRSRPVLFTEAVTVDVCCGLCSSPSLWVQVHFGREKRKYLFVSNYILSLYLIFIIELFCHLSLHQARIRFYISLAWDVLERTLEPTIHSLGTLCDKDQGLILDEKAAPRDCGRSRWRLRTNVKWIDNTETWNVFPNKYFISEFWIFNL